MWADLLPVGRTPRTGGYRRYAWTAEDGDAAGVVRRGGRRPRPGPDHRPRPATSGPGGATPTADGPGLVLGSHLDSVPDGGAFDGPLGVVVGVRGGRRAARRGVPARPGRSRSPASATRRAPGSASPAPGPGCSPARSTADRARGLRDADGTTMAEAMAAAGVDPARLGRDDETLRRVGTFVELHVEQGRGAAPTSTRPVAVGVGAHLAARPLAARPRRAGQPRRHHPARRTATTRCSTCAAVVLAARERPRAGTAASRPSARCGSSRTASTRSRRTCTGWLDARGADAAPVRRVVADVAAAAGGRRSVEESWTAATALRPRARRTPRGDCSDDAPAARHRRRPRRGHPRRGRRPDGDAVRPQPDRRLALPGRARRAGRLPGRRRGARPRARSRAGLMTRYCGRARLAADRPGTATCTSRSRRHGSRR